MHEPDTHKAILVKILKDIYLDPDIRSVLGFKGGTAAMLFYQLPRMSVDLDFDLLDETKEKAIMEKIPLILKKYGKLEDSTKKRFTLFFLLSYKKNNKKIKVEISRRSTSSSYESKSLFGIPMLVMKKEDMFANKIAALLTRRELAYRDVFDIWFFLDQETPINAALLKERTTFAYKDGLQKALQKISAIRDNQILHGLGELLDEKQKIWVKKSLRKELDFYLRLYMDKNGSV